MVQFSNQPAPVPDQLIEELRKHESNHTPGELFSPGDRVRITDGAFAEIEALFLAMDGQERVVLLLNLLQREQRVLLPLDLVRKA